MASPDYAIPRDVISGGGGLESASASYDIGDVLAQPGPVGESTSADYLVEHGYLVETDIFPDAIFSANLLDDSHSSGVAWTDVDHDGDWDLYITRGTGGDHQDYVFVNSLNGFFSQESDTWVGTETTPSLGVAFADYDSDGDLDGCVQNADATGALWRNEGGSFSNKAAAEGIVPVSSQMPSWGDYDGDGLIDLVLANDSGGLLGLFWNTGNYAVAGATGFAANTDTLTVNTQGVGAWADLSNDGRLDLYVAQTAGSDLLFINEGASGFQDHSSSAGIDALSRDGQGVAFGDYNTDGYLDIYVSCGGTDSDILWLNDGDTSPADGVWDGTFTDASVAAGISDAGDGRSCTWFDVDNDGDLDIYVANAGDQPDLLYVNNGDGTFRKLPTGKAASSYGCAVADYDKDGDLDIIVTGDSAHFTLYRNECPNHNHFAIRPTDALGNMNCAGAQVLLRDHTTKQLVGMVQIDGGSGRGCQNQYDAHFGVPNSTNEYDIEVRFTRNRGGEQVIVDGTVNPDLDGVSAGDVDLGRIEVRENGRIVLSHGIAYTHADGNQDVYVVPKAGGTPVQLTTNAANDHSPNWAPDGQKLVFVSDRGAGGNLELYTIAADGANEGPLFAVEWTSSNEFDPAWSSDSTQIAFVTDKDGNNEVYVSNTAGTQTRNLTDDPAGETCPAWSANSAKIAFVSDRDGNPEIYTMNFDGSEPTRLTDNAATDTEPAWHPNGLYLAFSTDRDAGVFQIYAMQFDGTFQQPITSGGSDKRHPVFTSSGNEIIYESGGELHVMDFPTGDNDRVLADAGTGNSDPDYPLLFRQPPRTIVFGTQDGRVMYWADPVNTQLGNYARSGTDFVLPGFGDPVTWTRTYNSQDTMLGPLGHGWRFNYQIAVTEDADDTITVTWGDGSQDFFSRNINGDYVPLEDRTTHEFVKNPDDSYTLTTREGTVFEFFPIGVHAKSYDPNIVGKVHSITDKNGNETNLTYDGSGLLATVSQENGRNLSVTWENDPTHGYRITAVQEDIAGLPSPRSVAYAYDTNGDLVQVTGKDSVQYARFAYDENHRMTDVFTLYDGVAEVPTLHNEYDEDGRVTLQRDGNGNESTIDYAEVGERLEATVTDARANTQTHIYDNYRRLVQYHDESDEILQYHYDSDGFKTHVVDREGETFRFPQNALGQPVAMEDPLGNISQVTYAPDGNPEARVVSPEPGDPGQDRVTQYGYDPNGNLSAVTDALGNAAQTRYNAKGQPTEIEDELENVTELIYDPATGDLVMIRNELGHETTFERDERGRLTKVIDAEGNEVEFSYRDDDQQEWVKDARGNFTYFSYYDGGMLEKVTNALGHESSFTYDGNLNVETATDPRGHTTTYEYDENNNAVRVSDVYQGTPREFTYVYDECNRLVSVTDPEGNTVEMTYDVHGRVTTLTDARGQKYHTDYDEAGRVTRTYTTLDASTFEVLYEYNGVGELLRTTLIDPLGPNPAGIVTQYEYDDLGRLVRVTDDQGNEQTTEYYAADGAGAFYGAVSRTVDINGRETRYEYDAIGRLVDQYDNIGRRTHYEYDDAGRLVALQQDPDDADGDGDLFVTQYEYDGNGNVVRTTTPAGDVIDTDYDALNRPIKSYLPYPEGGTRGAYTEYVYDEDHAIPDDQLGLLTRLIDPEGHETHYAYDEDGNVLTSTDAEGNEVENTYDLLGRAIKVASAKGSPDESEVQYEYDENGNRTKITKIMDDPPNDSQDHDFEYDLLNRNTSYTDPIGRQTTMAYDLAGLLTRHETHDALVTTYEYDSLYRITLVNYPDGSSATRTYDDANGHPLNLLSVVNTDLGTTSRTYDGMDRVTSVTDRYGKIVGYEYDHFDRVETLIYPDGLEIDYTYNTRHQITSVTDWLGNSAAYTYDDQARLAQQLNSNSTRTRYTYQENGWLASLVNERTDGTPIAAYTITADDVGNRTRIDRDEPLLPFPYEEWTSSTFDLANQIETDGTLEYDFDDRGSLIQERLGTDTQKGYVYDYANRLTQVVDLTSGNPVVTEYEYDDSGTRVATDHDGEEMRFTVDRRGMGWVIAQNDGGDSPQWYYVYGNGLAWRVNGETTEAQFYHGDHIASTTAITDASGGIVQAYSYDAFGQALHGLSSDTVRDFQFVGLLGVHSEPNGLIFMRARFCNPRLGRFVTEDPLYALNRYSYATNSPLVVSDPTGQVESESGLSSVVAEIAEVIADRDWASVIEEANERRAAFWRSVIETATSVAQTVASLAAPAPLGPVVVIPCIPLVVDLLERFGIYLDSTSGTLAMEVLDQEATQEAGQSQTASVKSSHKVSGFQSLFGSLGRREAQVQAQMSFLTAGRGWEGMSGRYGLRYRTVTEFGETRRFLVGFWYANESRIANMLIPGAREAAAQKALSAHAALVNSVTTGLLGNYGLGTGTNGRNTPFIPEVYQIEVVEGTTRAFAK